MIYRASPKGALSRRSAAMACRCRETVLQTSVPELVDGTDGTQDFALPGVF